jgi:enoyl-CoA hydratase
MADLVLIDRPRAGIAVVTFNRPEKYNALSSALLRAFDQALTELRADDDLRAIVLTGADPAFCAGLDLNQLGDGGGAAFGRHGQDPLGGSPVPVIAAVNGVAVTGGLEIALACDFRIASDRARFADTHTRVGVTPGWGLTARLPQAVGQSWARQMSFTGDFVDAPLALRIGLVNEVVPHGDLLARCAELAASIASTSPATLGRIRHAYDVGRDGTGADSLGAEAEWKGTSFLMEDPGQFAARRAAVFSRGRGQ